MSKREFKYHPSDFGALTVKVLHMDLLFEVHENHTDVDSRLRVRTVKPIRELALDATNLEVHEVSCEGYRITHEYNKKENKLHVDFGQAVPKGVELAIRTRTTCRPTKNVLEGLYYDETPPGCPCQQVTQCQQWGFQRIVPCIDDMTAKCTYTTIIRADKRYTNIITNGDQNKPVKDLKNGRVEVQYDNVITPMATYLFFLGVGTYATFNKEFRYPDGRRFMLELLVPPSSDQGIAHQALEILHDAILWVHLFTGPDTYKNAEKSKSLWGLMKQKRYEEAKQQASTLRLGYQYTGKVYREIAVQNSNFGGMENVGNTVITANRIMPYPSMGDLAFMYLIAVKVHEYYHNLNGSEVTGWSPFEIWLNEAVTVFIENRYCAFCFGEEYERLETVLRIIAPHDGTLAEDASPASMPIEPEGFNTPDELISGITYVKAPEFVRMIETTMGKENFVKALDHYHTLYKHSNATWQQWISCMERFSEQPFKGMAEVWLKQTGWPTVTVKSRYVRNSLTLTLSQSGSKMGKPYQFPFELAVFDESGKKTVEKKLFISKKVQRVVIKTRKPGFISLNRGFSFYGKVVYLQSRTALLSQVQHDDDPVSRFMAFDRLWNQEKSRLLNDPSAEVDKELISQYHSLLADYALMQRVGAQFLTIFDAVDDKGYAYDYQALYDVRERILTALAKDHEEQLLRRYLALQGKQYQGTDVEQRIASSKDRAIKNTCLSLLSRLDTPNIHKLIRKQFENTINASDKMTAFRLYLKSSANDKAELARNYGQVASRNLVTWEQYLASVAGNEADDALALIKDAEAMPSFRIEQSNDQRALYAAFAANKRRSLVTKEGRDFMKNCILKLAPLNEYNTIHILEALKDLDNLKPNVQVPLVEMMQAILARLDSQKLPSVTSYIRRVLKGSPKAMKAYAASKKKR